jgi:hypothetical protein
MSQDPRRSWRIGVIGAGAAGLTAARALTRAGFPHVTVLESEHRVGGKCCTFYHQGRSFELGAGALTPKYVRVRELLKEHGLHASRGSVAAYVHLDDRSVTRVPDHTRSWPRVAVEVAKLAATLVRHPDIRHPGLAGIDDDLRDPFATWARRHHLEAAAELIAPWFTGFGYGYLDEIPAAYVLKFVSLSGFPTFEILEVGYQGLWERVARHLDVRRGVSIHSVERGDEIVVRADGDTWRFDALLVTCPIEAATRFLDLDEHERHLFAQVVYNDYHVIGAIVRDLPPIRYAFIPEHLDRDSLGRPMFWFRRWYDSDLVLFYALACPGDTLAATTARVEEDVRRLGGAFERVEVAKPWRYFPHVGAEAMAAGFYERLEAKQGERRTYYAGELLSFAAVEPVVAYAEQLVRRFFASPRTRPLTREAAPSPG